MSSVPFEPVMEKRSVLVDPLGRVTQRHGDLVAAGEAEIARLEAEVMRLRGELIMRDTALALAREDHRVLGEAERGARRRAA